MILRMAQALIRLPDAAPHLIIIFAKRNYKYSRKSPYNP